MSKPKQRRIPGTERPDHPDIEDMCLSFEDAAAEWDEAGKRREQRKAEVRMMIKLRGLKSYRYYSKRAGKYRLAKLDDQEPKLSFADSDEQDESDIGEGVDIGEGSGDAPPSGLIADAERAMDEANAAENEDGDVVVPDKAAPRSKKSKARKPSSAKKSSKGRKR